MKTILKFLKDFVGLFIYLPHEAPQPEFTPLPPQVDEVERFSWHYLSPADRPVIDGLEQHEIVFAKDQPEYIPLRALVSKSAERRVMSRWTLTPEQRKAVADGADVFLTLSTFGSPLQPITLAVSDKPNRVYFEHSMGLNSTGNA